MSEKTASNFSRVGQNDERELENNILLGGLVKVSGVGARRNLLPRQCVVQKCASAVRLTSKFQRRRRVSLRT